jgi:uncharacterized protein (DUF1919 family)
MILHFIQDRVLYPFANRFRQFYEKVYFRKLRKALKNRDFSLFSPNCYAGLIYHRLGLEFASPTINLLFPVKKQYLRFVSNLEYYLQRELVFIDDPQYSCPVAMLEDVKLVFNHYDSVEQAATAWNRRKQRVNYSNVFLIFDDIADAQYEDLLAFSQIQCAGKIIFTAKKYDDLPNVIQLSKYKRSGCMKAYLLDKSIWTGKNAADKDFDFVSWLNSGI